MAASTAHPPLHAVARAVDQLDTVLDEVADAALWSMTPDETAATLTRLTRVIARATGLELRVAHHADTVGVGEDTGATSTANWWAHTTRQTRPEAHRKMRLATALAETHEPVRAALAAGDVLVDQAWVIVDAVDALPAEVDPALVERAERHLIGLAADHEAKALKVLGRGLFEVIAPDEADAHEARLLEREEQAAAADMRFTMAEDGHGRVHGRFTLDAVHGAMLKKALLAIAAPKHRATVEGRLGVRRPGPERMGRAFCEYLERYPVERLPNAGGLAATVVVTMTLESLTGGLGPATLDTGERISASLARRLACEAGIIPVVLGGRGEVLDVGRRTRFHTTPMRTALTVRDQGCTAEGCDAPPALCHAHHDQPWSQGGDTSVSNGRLLCPRHHARAHDPAYTTTHHHGGKVAFTRRT
jgi:Domain of unknown function (DUF222)